MLVRSRLGQETQIEADAKSIIVPLDGSAVAEQTLELADFLARISSIPVTLLRALPSSLEIQGQLEHYADLSAGAIEPADADALGYLDGIKRRMVENGVSDVRTIVAHGGAAETILRVAEENDESLVVMISMGGRVWAAGFWAASPTRSFATRPAPFSWSTRRTASSSSGRASTLGTQYLATDAPRDMTGQFMDIFGS